MRRDLTPFRHAARLTFAATALSLSALPCFAETKTIFAPGVTADSGWYDVNKKSTQARQYSDSNMCWAAASSNLLQYWQDCYTKAGNELPDGTPNGAGSKIYDEGMGCYESAIFEVYMDNWDLSIAGQIFMGVPWYFSGTYPNYADSSAPKTTGSGGYFSQKYSSFQEQWGADFALKDNSGWSIWGRGVQNRTGSALELFSACILDTLRVGAGAINFNTGLKGGGHTTTLWGADIDASGIVLAVYVADSDDRATTLVDGEVKPTLTRYAITSNETERNVYLCDYKPDATYGNVEITGYYGLPVFIIPEPAAFGLLAGLFALVPGVARRRNSVRARI